MSTRNLYWLVAIVVVGVVLWVVGSWWLGLVGAAVTLVFSEVVERLQRRKRGAASPLRGAVAKKRGGR